jgi:HEPN domain-containing protein
MKDRSALARGWFRKADSDLADARRTTASEGPYDTACFHAQQAVEKYLKGVLAWRSQQIPRTHDLEELQRLCTQPEAWPELETCDLTDLTAFAVELRYDAEFWPPQPAAADAVKLAERVRTCVLTYMPPDTRP